MAKREPQKVFIQKDVIVEAGILADLIGVDRRTLLKYADELGWRTVKVGSRTLIDTGSIFGG